MAEVVKPGQLVGDRITMRPLTREDLPRRLQWVNDPEVQKMFAGVTTSGNDEYDMRAWFHMVSEDPLSEQWAIQLPGREGEYVGDVDLHSIMPATGEASISPLFADPAVRPREIRRDVLDTVVRYAFEEKGLRTLWAQIPDTDGDTIAVLEAMGFQPVETTLLDFIEGVTEVTLRLDRADYTGSR